MFRVLQTLSYYAPSGIFIAFSSLVDAVTWGFVVGGVFLVCVWVSGADNTSPT